MLSNMAYNTLWSFLVDLIPDVFSLSHRYTKKSAFEIRDFHITPPPPKKKKKQMTDLGSSRFMPLPGACEIL